MIDKRDFDHAKSQVVSTGRYSGTVRTVLHIGH